jgi:hypothetical protein
MANGQILQILSMKCLHTDQGGLICRMLVVHGRNENVTTDARRSVPPPYVKSTDIGQLHDSVRRD